MGLKKVGRKRVTTIKHRLLAYEKDSIRYMKNWGKIDWAPFDRLFPFFYCKFLL
jgi:hypothetical protein